MLKLIIFPFHYFDLLIYSFTCSYVFGFHNFLFRSYLFAWFFFFFESESHCVALSDLKHTM